MTALSAWNRFWFESRGSLQMRLFRIGVASVLFCSCAVRSFDLDFFYSNDGLVPSGVMSELIPMRFRFSVLDWFPSHAALWAFNLLLLLSLVTLALGIWPRLSAWIALILHLSFLHRNMAVAIGVDMIASFYLFYLGFADYRREENSDLEAILGSMAYRLCQIQLCVIYGFSGLQKLKGVAWWRGEGLWGTLANAQWARWDFSWMSHFPLILTLASFVVLFWEIYFPALIWFDSARRYLLFFGVLMHLGIAISVNLPIFAALMIASYALFLDASHSEWILSSFKKKILFIQVRQQAAE